MPHDPAKRTAGLFVLRLETRCLMWPPVDRRPAQPAESVGQLFLGQHLDIPNGI